VSFVHPEDVQGCFFPKALLSVVMGNLLSVFIFEPWKAICFFNKLDTVMCFVSFL
jgi:hypothetical protein